MRLNWTNATTGNTHNNTTYSSRLCSTTTFTKVRLRTIPSFMLNKKRGAKRCLRKCRFHSYWLSWNPSRCFCTCSKICQQLLVSPPITVIHSIAQAWGVANPIVKGKWQSLKLTVLSEIRRQCVLFCCFSLFGTINPIQFLCITNENLLSKQIRASECHVSERLWPSVWISFAKEGIISELRHQR